MNVNRKKEVKVALLADYDSTYKQSEILHQKLLEQSNKIQNYTYVWARQTRNFLRGLIKGQKELQFCVLV